MKLSEIKSSTEIKFQEKLLSHSQSRDVNSRISKNYCATQSKLLENHEFLLYSMVRIHSHLIIFTEQHSNFSRFGDSHHNSGSGFVNETLAGIMTAPILYATQMSAPCRAVFLAAIAIGLDLDIRETALNKGEHLTEGFLKMNPQHTVPTLDDNGYIVWDSHAINGYLVGTYAKDDSVYPKDLKKKAIIDQRLHFDSGVLFPLLRNNFKTLFGEQKNPLTEDRVAQINEAYDFLNKFLEGKKWLTGDTYTLADMSTLPTMGGLETFVPVASYPNIVRWMKTCQDELPGYASAYLPGATMMSQAIQQTLAAVS